MLDKIRNWWSRWRPDWRGVSEINACAPFDLDRIARDLQMTVSELRQVAASGNSELLFSRLRERGIDVKTIDPDVLHDLQRCCGICLNKALCAHELEDGPIAARWPAYCPNQVTIDALTLMKCH
ncbi:MAG TPA: hypothetical protein VHA55_09960 [Pseudorhodoplanes sp.]|jgi:hypothetical protein|nr:hypothetical protein [Pseudorhodoplanes sp.]